jgi:hypothetical protein
MGAAEAADRQGLSGAKRTLNGLWEAVITRVTANWSIVLSGGTATMRVALGLHPMQICWQQPMMQWVFMIRISLLGLSRPRSLKDNLVRTQDCKEQKYFAA